MDKEMSSPESKRIVRAVKKAKAKAGLDYKSAFEE